MAGEIASSGVVRDVMALPSRAEMAQNLIEAGRRYWPRNATLIQDHVAHEVSARSGFSTRFIQVPAPKGAQAFGVGAERTLMVPECCHSDAGTDWLRAAFLMLHCAAEQVHEHKHGPSQSYTGRMPYHDGLFDRAWVNRILLVLRQQAAGTQAVEDLFGPPAPVEFVLTHDVDAIYRPAMLRLKQGAFDSFNALRMLGQGRLNALPAHLRRGLRKGMGKVGSPSIRDALLLNRQAGREAVFLFYTGQTAGRRGLRHTIFDPSYRIDTAEMSALLSDVHGAGHLIGLHPGFEIWRNATKMREEADALQAHTGMSPQIIRQHWLRFSFEQTWAAQAEAGFRLDMTLGFNNRAGLRNSAALRYRPYNLLRGRFEQIEALPMVLMDSHLHDYAQGQKTSMAVPDHDMDHWVEEISAVGGIASVNWHPHTLHPHYEWRPTFEALLAAIGPGKVPSEMRAMA